MEREGRIGVCGICGTGIDGLVEVERRYERTCCCRRVARASDILWGMRSDQTGPLSFLLVMTNIALVLFLATSAHAQAETVQQGADQLLEKGVLGVLCVIEGAIIWMLFREIRMQHAAAAAIAAASEARQVEWAIKATAVLTRVNDHLDRQDERERSGPHSRV